MAKSDIPFDGNVSVTWNSSSLGELVSITADEEGNVVDTTGAGDSGHNYEEGTPDVTVTVVVKGGVSCVAGDKAALAVTGMDGSITNGIIASVSESGSLGNPIESTVVIKESSAAA